jgi:hypothetical protein
MLVVMAIPIALLKKSAWVSAPERAAHAMGITFRTARRGARPNRRMNEPKKGMD